VRSWFGGMALHFEDVLGWRAARLKALAAVLRVELVEDDG
jgi:hypothetical protein